MENGMFSTQDSDVLALELATFYRQVEADYARRGVSEENAKLFLTDLRQLGIRLLGAAEFDATLADTKL